MVRSVAERYAVGVFAFMAAATWLGIGVVHGLLCLFVALLGSHGMRLYQRRNGSRAQSTTRRAQAARPRRTADRASSSELYDADRQDFDWRAAGDAAW